MPKKWQKKFNELMAVEEDMKAFFPQKLKEPLSALTALTKFENQSDQNDSPPKKELQIGSVNLSGQDDIEQAIG